MKLLTGLFRAARKRLMTTDNDMGMFRDKLNELVAQKDSLSDEEVAKKIEELKGYTSDLPDGDDKAKLDRFLDDFASIKEQDEATAKEAASMVADVFEKLDTEAMKDVPAAGEAPEEPAEEAAEEPAEETAEEAVEEVVEETEVPEEGESNDADPNPAYTLEEIYQFCKKRQAEDAAAEEATNEKDVTDGADEEEDDEEVVTDHAPTIPVTINRTLAEGSLGAIFAGIKNGGR